RAHAADPGPPATRLVWRSNPPRPSRIGPIEELPETFSVINVRKSLRFEPSALSFESRAIPRHAGPGGGSGSGRRRSAGPVRTRDAGAGQVTERGRGPVGEQPEGFRQAMGYPLFGALFHRRSRRISKGIRAVPAGSHSYTSDQPPQPLSPLE